MSLSKRFFVYILLLSGCSSLEIQQYTKSSVCPVHQVEMQEVPIVSGLPSPEMGAQAERGEIILSGCMGRDGIAYRCPVDKKIFYWNGKPKTAAGQTMENPAPAATDDTAFSIEEILTRMQKAEAAIEDMTFRWTTVLPQNTSSAEESNKEIAVRYWFKRPYSLLTESVGDAAAQLKILVKKEGDKISSQHWFPQSQKIQKYEAPIESQSLRVPFVGNFLEEMERFVKDQRPYFLEKKEDDEGPYYLIHFPAKPEQDRAVSFYVRTTDWLIFKKENYDGEKLTLRVVLDEMKINSHLSDEIFSLNAPANIPVVAYSPPQTQSAEIMRYGLVTPETVKNSKEAEGRELSAEHFCSLLEFPEVVQETATIPGVLKTGFGFAFKVHGTPLDGMDFLTARFLHPPVTNPNTGEVKTQEDSFLIVKFDKMETIGWYFAYEWEVVPGDWMIQILKGKEVLLEKTFQVTSGEDIFKFMDIAGTRIKFLKEQIAQNPQDAMAVKNLGNTYLDMGDNDSAIVKYTEAIAIERHPNFFNNRCLAWNEKKDFQKALEDCNTALSINPQHTSAFINRGNTFRLMKEYDKAIDDYTRSLQVTPAGDNYNPPMAYFNRGLVYQGQEKFDAAIADYTKVIEYNPSDARAYFNRGEAYASIKDLEKAKADYEKTLQLDPQNSGCRRRLEELSGN